LDKFNFVKFAYIVFGFRFEPIFDIATDALKMMIATKEVKRDLKIQRVGKSNKVSQDIFCLFKTQS